MNTVLIDGEQSERSDGRAFRMSLPLLCRKVPTRVLGQTDIVGRIAAAAEAEDQRGCRNTASIPAATPSKHRRVGQQQSPRARSGFTRHSKHARTVGNQSDVRNLPWLVRRHRVESSSPVSLYADSQGSGHAPPSLLRAVFSDANRPQRTLRLGPPPPATVSRSLEQHPARTSGAVTKPDLAVPCGDRRQRPDPHALRSTNPLVRVGHASPRACSLLARPFPAM